MDMNAPGSSPLALPLGYESLRRSIAWADGGNRSTLVITGKDAVGFVDHFTTAALLRLAPGEGTHGFFTDAKGWVLALSHILRTQEGLWIDAPAGMARMLHEHLEHYHIREQMECIDASATRASFLVAGPQAAEWLGGQGSDHHRLIASDEQALPSQVLHHVQGMLGGMQATVVRVDWVGAVGFMVQVAEADRQRFATFMRAAGITEAGFDCIHTARIEEGHLQPADILPKTLPQECGMDHIAISFTKGCYLGQETVARIDALGHVNRRVVAIAINASTAPPVGATVRCRGELIGSVTSSCVSPQLGQALALAMLFVKGLAPSMELEVDGVAARVVTVPLASVAGADHS